MSPQELQVQKKRELEGKDESTIPARTFVPTADIYEDRDTLKVILEMPGVGKDGVEITVENDVLTISGRVDFSKYEGLQPLYTEYNVGHFARTFTLSRKIDQQQISAQLEHGVLTLTVPKAKEAQPRRIAIG